MSNFAQLVLTGTTLEVSPTLGMPFHFERPIVGNRSFALQRFAQKQISNPTRRGTYATASDMFVPVIPVPSNFTNCCGGTGLLK
jgi:hypothetical protein